MSELVLPPAVKSIGLSTLDNRKPQSLLEAVQHNRRHPDGRGWRHKSDPKEVHLNECLMGPETCEAVVALHAEMMTGAGYAPKRKDYSQAFELLFTTPCDFTVDFTVYFAWCLEWTQANLGRDIVLTADSHFDEGKDGKAPHLHILIAPISDGKWVGNALTSGKAWPIVQAKFGRDIEAAFDLHLLPQLQGKALTEAATAVTARLTELLEAHLDADVLKDLLKLARRKPAGLIGPLGITEDRGGDGGAAFRRIATSTGKGGKTERWAKPYGIEPNAYGIEIDRERTIPFLCSGIAEAPPPDQHFDDFVQPLTDIPNADGEIAAPTRQAPGPAPTPRPAPALPTERVETLAPPKPLTYAFRPATLPANTVDSPAQTEAPFVELTTRHRDCDQSPDRYDSVTGDFIPTKPLVPRLNRQAADGWVTAALATRSRTPDARRH